MDGPGRTKRLNLFAILSASIAYGIGMGLTLPLLGLILERRGIAGSVNGLNLATAGLAAFVVTPFVPRWIAKFGASHFLSLSLAVSALSLLALYAVPSLWLWFPMRFVLSSGLNGLFVASEFWINRLADEKTRGRYVSVYVMCIAGSFGIGPAILQIIGTRGFVPFGAGAMMLAIAIVPVVLARRTAPRIDDDAEMSVFAVMQLAPTAFSAAAVFGAIDAGVVGLLPVYTVRLGYSEVHAALVVTAMSAGSIVFQYPLGVLADRMNRKRLLILCTASGLIGAALTPFAVKIPLFFYGLLLVWGGLIGGIYSIGLTLLGERFKGPTLASANAGFVMAYCMGLLAGPAVEGAALDAWNPHGLMVVLGAISAVYLAFLLRRRPVPAPP